MRIAIVFPGQGTQAPGMGRPWVDHPSFGLVDRLGDALGEPLRHLLLDADAEELGRTRAAQLSVLVTSLVAWDALRGAFPEIAPVAFAGHSLGQVTALIAAEVLDAEAGARFAARRAELTQAAADAHPGRMAALLGASVEEAEAACAAAPDACWLANDNAPGQVVIAGTPDGVEAATARAKELGVRRVMALAVGGAFHTPLMDDARAGLRDALAGVALRDPTVPVVSNADGSAVRDGDSWRTRLVDHVTTPVRWRTSMETLRDLGAECFVEVGYGSMIAGLAKRAVADVVVHGLATPDDLAPVADRLRAD
ncbi:MAG TPA: ACP S-malonyltransferase [Acidimicrobiia bacterium]|nr:ACP S-malonyltransferase [Acidimicrobiia bacterium]